MRTDYEQLRGLWAEAARRAGNLDVWNRALVYNYLASAAEYTALVLNNQGNDAAGAEDARSYAKDMRTQDLLRRGYNLASKVSVILGFGSVAGLLLGALAGIVSIVEQAGQEGAQVDLKPLVVKLLGTSGVALIVLRGMKSAGEQVGKAWDRMLASANAATQVINATLDSAEQQFYSSLGARRPSRVSLKIAGPGAAILLMLGIALVAAIPVYFVFVSFTTPHSPSARPF